MLRGEVVDRSDGRPLPGVVVSDGSAVTRTGVDGTFAFSDRGDTEFVFVTVPSTHEAIGDGWFARPTEALRFALTPRAGGAASRCRFVQVTDLHVAVDGGDALRPLIESGVRSPAGVQPTGAMSGAELRADLRAIVERERPDFIVATGDLADGGRPAELVAYRDAITALGAPVASVPGNHDYLSVLSQESIDEFFASWSPGDDGVGAGEAFQRAVFGGDWRRPKSGRAPWVETIGPLYYSFDWAGVHFVAYDGEGLRRYGHDYPQDEWLAADLARVAPGTPIVVCTHFPEDADFYRARFGGVHLIGSLSGHWHGRRVWHDGAASHWTSSTLGFGGIDFSPRGYAVFDVDGDSIAARFVAMDGGAELQFASEQRVSDEASGLEFVLSVLGGLEAFACDSGARVWAAALGEPSQRWTLGAPVVVGDTLYVGSAMSVHAFAARTGESYWRTDLASMDWAASHAGIDANEDVVVIGALNDEVHLAALEARTGELRWKHAGRDIAGVSARPVIVRDAVVAAFAPGWLAAYTLADGTRRWKQPLDDAWPVAVTIDEGRALVRLVSGTVTAHDLETGERVAQQDVGRSPDTGRPYARGV